MRAKLSGFKLQKAMKVLMIRTPYSKEQDFYTRVLMPALNEVLGDWGSFPWHSSVVCLINADDIAVLQNKRDALAALAKQYKLLVGVSNVFNDISQFSEHFEQARTALTFSGRISTDDLFFYYQDYAFYQ